MNKIDKLIRKKILPKYENQLGSSFLGEFKKKTQESNPTFSLSWKYAVALSFSIAIVLISFNNSNKVEVLAFSNENLEIIANAEMLENMDMFEQFDKIYKEES